MTRLNNKKELWAHLSEVGVMRDTSGINTTVGANAAAGATSLTVASGTGSANGDIFRLNDGNIQQLNEISSGGGTTSWTLKYPLYYAVVTGDVAVEQLKTPLGHIVDGGVTVDFTGDDNAANVATRRLVLGYLTGHMEISASWAVLGLNPENYASRLGMLESNVTGSGTPSSPNRLVIDGTKIKEQNDLAWYFNGVRKDGGFVEFQIWGAELDWTGSQQYGRGAVSSMPFKARATSAVAVIQYN